MSNEPAASNILDLTSQQTLFELAIEDHELLGPIGAKLIADLKERASEAEYTHMYFRDPIRSGIIWFVPLEGESLGLGELPTRARLDECRQVTEKVFPGFLKDVESAVAEAENEEEVVMAQIPPLTIGVGGNQLSTALEYIVFIYPSMVRAWAALIFTYDEILEYKEGAESARQACMGTCQYSQIVTYLVGDPLEA